MLEEESLEESPPGTVLEGRDRKDNASDTEERRAELRESLIKFNEELQGDNAYCFLTIDDSDENKDKNKHGHGTRVLHEQGGCDRTVRERTTTSAPESELCPDEDVRLLGDYLHACAVCYEIMYRPHRVQPCGHTFCVACLYVMAKFQNLGNTLCPLCRCVIRRCSLDADLDTTIRQTHSTLYFQRKVVVDNDKTLGKILPSSSSASLTAPKRRQPAAPPAPQARGHRRQPRPIDYVLTIILALTTLLLVTVVVFFWAKYLWYIGLFILFYQFVEMNAPCKAVMLPIGYSLIYYHVNPSEQDTLLDGDGSGFTWAPDLAYVLLCYGCVVLATSTPAGRPSVHSMVPGLLIIFYLLSTSGVCQLTGLVITVMLLFKIATTQQRKRFKIIALFSCCVVCFLLITSGNLPQSSQPPLALENVRPLALLGLLILLVVPFCMPSQRGTQENYRVFSAHGVNAIACLISDGKCLDYGRHFLLLVSTSIGVSSFYIHAVVIFIYSLLLARSIRKVLTARVVSMWSRRQRASRKLRANQACLTLSALLPILYRSDLLSGCGFALCIVGVCIALFCISRKL